VPLQEHTCLVAAPCADSAITTSSSGRVLFTGAVLFLAITFACITWIRVRSPQQFRAIGALWVVLTLSFEFDVKRWTSGYSWQRIASDFDLAHGGLLVMLCAPSSSQWLAAHEPNTPLTRSLKHSEAP
jgi:hypothetical protein